MVGLFGGWGFAWMIFIYIFVAAIIVGVILLIVWLIRRASYPYEDLKKTKGAIEILKERYARGEISKQEFEEIKKDIS
ncbi:MAG: SHOCT domain-containing protein [Actinobacteria bacterium]|nr:SHOCT domain-containing protein [Actinomycetota bacterium]